MIPISTTSPKHLLVVCHGNVCRSPLAAAILSKSMPDCSVDSAGFVGPNRPAAKKVREYAWEHLGLDLSSHRSRLIDISNISLYDMILYMDSRNLRNLQSVAGRDGRYQSLGEFVGLRKIADPGYLPRGDKLYIILSQVVDAANAAVLYLRGQ